MAFATTAKYEQLVLETSDNGGTTWSRICGLTDVEINRTANLDTVEVPDCDDESLPFGVERQVRSLEFNISGTGVWAQESHGTMMDWFYSSASKDVRIGHLNADSGDTEYEEGSGYLTNLSNSRTKGQKVTASIEVQFDGTPTRVAKA